MSLSLTLILVYIQTHTHILNERGWRETQRVVGVRLSKIKERDYPLKSPPAMLICWENARICEVSKIRKKGRKKEKEFKNQGFLGLRVEDDMG